MRAIYAAGLLLAGSSELLCGCARAPVNQAELSTEDACRALASQAYDEQHRDLLSRGDSQATTPFSGSGAVALPSDGLSDQYAHDVAVDECVSRKTSSAPGGSSFGPQGAH